MHIKRTGTDFKLFKTTVEYDSISVLKLPGMVFPATQDIWQIILVMPSILTGMGFDVKDDIEEVTVTVEGVSDTFEIKMLPGLFDKEKNLKIEIDYKKNHSI